MVIQLIPRLAEGGWEDPRVWNPHPAAVQFVRQYPFTREFRWTHSLLCTLTQLLKKIVSRYSSHLFTVFFMVSYLKDG